ncbi:MAG: histidine kinase dimerization/phospho-acceptor domain-containing protein, partial [Pseudomonadota bacterium]
MTLFAGPGPAQTSDANPLKVGFSSFAPFAYIDLNGDQTGFPIELAQELGFELGVPIVLEEVTTLDDLSGLRVGDLPFSRPQTDIFSRDNLIPVPFDTPKAMLNGLLDGTADVVLFGTMNFHALIDREGVTDEIVAVDPPYDQTQMAMALRFGLGGVREQLNAVIPGYVVSERYSALETRYFGTSDFWTSGRILVAWEIIGGAVVLVVGYIIWRNQRSRKQRQEQDRQKERFEEQKAHSKELARLVTELERSNRELDEFAYIASHDLKEPLRGIGINANFMMREDLPEKLHDRALRIGELTGRMEEQISDLLFFSRLGRGDHAEATAHVSEIIATIRDELREWLDENNGEIQEVGTIPAIAAAPHKIKVLLQNLIVNGIKYSHAERRIVEVGFLPSVLVNEKSFSNA